MWFDNEKFLKIDDEYHRHGLTAMRFPPSSGDLNPIENVWAKLRKDLAIREFEDLKSDTVITTLQFKQRVSQLLTSYGCAKPGKNFLTWRTFSEACQRDCRSARTTSMVLVASDGTKERYSHIALFCSLGW